MSQEKYQLLNTPISAGTYYIDNVPVSAEELCKRGEALDPSIRHKGWPGIMITGRPVINGVPQEPALVKILPHPNPDPTDTYVTTHEAAEVLTRHGHVVTNKPA